MILDYKYFFYRYFTYGFIAAEVFFIPILLSEDNYGKIELYKSVALLGPYALLGSFSGYIYEKYTLKKDSYSHLFFWSFFSSLPIGLIVALWYSNFILFVPFLLNSLSIVQEKRLQVNGNFFLSILFKPILSLALLLIILGLHLFSSEDQDVVLSLVIAYIVAYISWTTLCKKITGISLINFRILTLRNSLRRYLNLVNKGFIIYLSTIIISLLIFNYRLFIVKDFPSQLSSFSLAFNIAQFVFLGVNTIGYVLTVKIGEEIEEITKSTLKKVLLKSTLFFLALLSFGLLIVIFYKYHIKDFQNLIEFYLIIGSFLGLYYVASVISPIMLYKGTIKQSTIFLCLIFIIDYLTSIYLIANGFSSFSIIIKSGLLLLFSAFFNLYLIFFKSSILR